MHVAQNNIDSKINIIDYKLDKVNNIEETFITCTWSAMKVLKYKNKEQVIVATC